MTVSTTIASEIELLGKFKEPETYRLVVVALAVISLTKILEVAKKLVEVILTANTLLGLKLAAVRLVVSKDVKNPLVEVMEVAITIVDVMAVPEAVVNVRPPLSVPPAKGR